MTESKLNLGAIAQVLDPYARQARLAPALIVILPIGILVFVWFPALWSVWGGVLSVASSCGLILLLAQLARDRGKRREQQIFLAWGGKPSVTLLRHRDARIDAHTKARYISFLKKQLPDLALPTVEQESENPQRADAAYESVTAWLLTRTRDTHKFSILFRENISYGFRRNLWGLKPLGVIVALLAASVSTAVMIYQYSVGHVSPTPEVLGVTIVVWLLLIIWIAVVTPSWVRLPADAYGAQLLAACDTLNSSDTTASS